MCVCIHGCVCKYVRIYMSVFIEAQKVSLDSLHIQSAYNYSHLYTKTNTTYTILYIHLYIHYIYIYTHTKHTEPIYLLNS